MRRLLVLFGLGLILISTCISSASERDEMSCRSLLNGRQLHASWLFRDPDFPILAEVLTRLPRLHAEPGNFVAQLFVQWKGALNVSSLHELEKMLKNLHIEMIADLSVVNPTPDGKMQHSLAIFGSEDALKDLLLTRFQTVLGQEVQVFMDIVMISNVDVEFLNSVRRLNFDPELAKAVLPNVTPGQTPLSESELVDIFKDKDRGSFDEFMNRFNKFTLPDMAKTTFIFLGHYLHPSKRANYLQKILELNLKKSTTAMASSAQSSKAAGSLLAGIRILAEASSEDHPEQASRLPYLHRKGMVDQLLNNLGVPDRVRDIDPELDGTIDSEAWQVNETTDLPIQKPASKHLVFLQIHDQLLFLKNQVDKLILYIPVSARASSASPNDIKNLKGLSESLETLQKEINGDSEAYAERIAGYTAEFEAIDRKYRTPGKPYRVPIKSVVDGNLLQTGWVYEAQDPSGTHNQIVFDDMPIKLLKRRYSQLIPKFLEAMSAGIVPPKGTEGIKVITDIPQGPFGEVFEVKLLGRGHFRLVGCLKDRRFHVLRFDPAAPETKDAWNKKYRDLCR